MPVRGRPRPQRAPVWERWSLTTVRAILANPRYTGRQVWNRQPTAMDLIDPANTGLGHRQVQRWGLPDGWVISARPAHPALVSEEDFIAVQGIRAAARRHRTRAAVPAGRADALRDLRTAGRVLLVEQSTPPTGAATDTRARPRRTRRGRRTFTFARTASCRICPSCTCS